MKRRKLTLAVCDYDNNIVCDLYDNRTESSGQAVDIHVRSERNGWKELYFTIPSVCMGDNGPEKNYRLNYLIADYKIRLEDDYETDWYIISEPKVSHRAFSQDVTVVAGHVCQRLKMKNMALEFSDDEGNNVGTPRQFLDVILEGTGWTPGTVVKFLDDDGVTEKVRSLKASAKTGAFKLITDMCELFDAKAVFHGEGQTVDILPLNPFSRDIKYIGGEIVVGKPIVLKPGEIPSAVVDGTNVLEIYYDKNAKGISRTLNAENIVTRLSASTAAGNVVDGICDIKNAKHYEHTFTISSNNTEYVFSDSNATDVYFTISGSCSGECIYSELDPVSQSYVWLNNKAYHVYYEPKTGNPVRITNKTVTSVKNTIPFIMDFSYYAEVNLFTEEMFQRVAKFQREIPAYYQAVSEAQEAFNKKYDEASEVGNPMTGFAKLNVLPFERGEANPGEAAPVRVRLNKTTLYPDGVMYRSDYDEPKRKWFSWYAVNKLKANGDPFSGVGSVLLIIRNTTPAKWEKYYIHQIDERYHYEDVDAVEYNTSGTNVEEVHTTVHQKVCDNYIYGISEGEPEYFTIWENYDDIEQLHAGDRVYLLSTYAMQGLLGSRFGDDEAALQALDSSTKTGTETHLTDFIQGTASTNPGLPPEGALTTFGWRYVYDPFTDNPGVLYFCYGAMGDIRWYRAYCQDTVPTGSNKEYFYNTLTKEFFHHENGDWVLWDSVDDKRLATYFSKVNYYTLRRDMIHKGLYAKYQHTGTLAAGNYAIKTQFGFYWIFTLTQQAVKPWLDTQSMNVYQTNNVKDCVPVDSILFENAEHPPYSLFENISFSNGTINSDGSEVYSNTQKRSSNINVYELTRYQYNLPVVSGKNTIILVYDRHKNILQRISVTTTTGTFTTNKHAYFIRVILPNEPSSGNFIHVYNYSNSIYVDDKLYTVLSNVSSIAPRKGLSYLAKRFADLMDEVYTTYAQRVTEAQNAIDAQINDMSTILGEIYREGWWQSQDYVEGSDEAKMYRDALTNLKEIAKPVASYDVDFLDLYGTGLNEGFSVEDADEIDWPDIQVTDAAHLVDPEIDINLWAYIDQVNKCYDKPWETTISLNTNLSLISQHSFTDVMAHIAEVANETKARQVIYDRAENISADGSVYTDKLEGSILANINRINGGSSRWYTDTNGNIILEAGDNMSAMKLSGFGWALASQKNSDGDWQWRNSATGLGISADEITTGFLSARLISAGSITVDKLRSNVGQELDIGSNKALELYATVDGIRPAGTVRTTDARIIIRAGTSDSDPAKITVESGGEINMSAGGTFRMESKGQFIVDSADLLVIRSSRFNVYKDNQGNYHADIDGTITSEDGLIGGWKIEPGKLSAGSGTSHIELNSSKTSGAYALFAGAADGANAKFSVTNTGDVVSKNITISGGSISIMDGSTENFKVTNKGVLTAQKGTIGGWTISSNHIGNQSTRDASTIALTNATGTNVVFWAGGKRTSSLVGEGEILAPFRVTADGKMYASSGTIGGWTIDSAGKLKSGSGSAYVEYNSGTASGTYAILAGGTSSSTAKFTVTNEGAVTASNLTVTGGSISIKDGSTENFNVTNKGVLTAKKGSIGGWTISSNHIGNADTRDTSTIGLANLTGTSVIFWAGGKRTSSLVGEGDVLAPFRVTGEGKMYASGGTIGGWTIDSAGKLKSGSNTAYIEFNSSTTSGAYSILAGGTTSSNAKFTVTNTGAVTASDLTIKGGSISIKDGSTENFSVTNKGVLTAKSATITGTIYATAGTVGGWTIKSDYIGNASTITASTVGLRAANDETTVIFAGKPNTSTSYWADSAFAVLSTGAMKATNATITGSITAESGTIGGITANKDYGLYTNSKTTSTSTKSGFLISKDGAIYLGAYNSTSQVCPFQVTSAGALTATTATITGTIYANEGTIGGFTIKSAYIGSSTTKANSQTGLSYVSGDDNVAFWAGHTSSKSDMYANSTFAVKNDGTLKATNANITGTITSTSGSIGTWVIGSNYIGDASTLATCTIGIRKGTSSSHIVFFAGADGTGIATASFQVTQGGHLYASSADISGKITATSGKIAGWSIGTSTIYNYVYAEGSTTEYTKGVGMGTGTYAFYAGRTNAMSSTNECPFYVTNAGALKATSATITGTINATSGSIGGFTIKSGYIGSASTQATSQTGLAYVSGASNVAFWAGHDTSKTDMYANSAFAVKNDGTLKATNATITGSITASYFELTGDAAIPPSKVTGLTSAKTTYKYVVSTDGTTPPSTGWLDDRPSPVDKGKYLWTKIYTVNLDGTNKTAYNCEYYPKDGGKGNPGAYITTVLDLYNLNTAKPSKPTASTTIETTDVSKKWTTLVPTYIDGYDYYRSAKYTYSDNTVQFADVYIDYGLSVANEEAKSAANTVDPFKKDGLTWGQTWGGTTYGVCLTGSSYDRPMLIGSNKGITIAKSATSSDGAAVVINESGIKMHAASFTVTTTKSTAQTQTNALDMSTDGIKIYSGAKIEIKSGASFTVASSNFNIDTSGNVTMKGKVTATSGSIANWTIGSNFIANGESVTKSSVGIGDSTYTLWAGKGTSESSIANAKVYIKNDGSVKFGKFFSVDTSGNVTCSNLSMTGGSINGGDNIEITAKSIRIKSDDTYITLAGTSETADNAKTTADAANTKATNIENGTTAVKKLTSTGISISGNSITATATANINFASANSISFASGALSFSTISGSTGITLNNGSMTLASGNITLTGGKIIVGSATVGATIDGNKIDVNGSDGYVHLRTSDTNYAYIDPGIIDLKATKNGTTSQLIVNNTGVAIAGGTLGLSGSSLNIVSGQISINGRVFNDSNIFARDDIRIVTATKSEDTIISEMTGKHDWVLIKPFYNAEIQYIYGGYYSSTSSSQNHNIINMPQDGGSTAKAFGAGASWYQYVLTGTVERQTGEIGSDGTLFTLNLSNSASLTSSVSQSARVNTSYQDVTNFTISTGYVSANLCSEGALIYLRLDSSNAYSKISNLRLTCTCDLTSSKAPCTVYYFP